MVSVRVGAGIILALCLCLSACADGPSQPTEMRTAPSGKSFQPFPIPAERQAAVVDASSTFERELVKDGQLSFEEYERSVFANVAWLESKGLTISHSDSTVRYDLGDLKPGPRLSRRGIYHFVVGAPDSFGPDVLREASADCTEQFNKVVSLLWAERSQPTVRELQQYRDAISAFTEYLRLRPSDASGYLELGRAFMQQGNIADAVAAFGKSLQLNPNQPEATELIRGLR